MLLKFLVVLQSKFSDVITAILSFFGIENSTKDVVIALFVGFVAPIIKDLILKFLQRKIEKYYKLKK